MKVAVLGSPFDPPHRGHLWLAEKALTTKLVDEVWLMPNFSHPWREPEATASKRTEMCELLKTDLPVGMQDKVKVSDLEIKRQGKSYTIDTVEELKNKYPDLTFFWLMGSDRLADLNKWKDIDKLLKEIEFIVLPKKPEISSTMIRDRIKKRLPISDLVTSRVEEYIKKNHLYV